MRIALSSAAVVLMLSACSGNSDNDQQPVKEGADSVVTETPAQPAPPPDASAAAAPTKIPASMTGRWGLVPVDCTSTKGDAKGLLVVSENQLKFYESVGKLAKISEGDDTKIRANFDFTGEGMTWKREMTMEVQDGGTTLLRQEFGEDAMPNPLKYSRC